MAESGSSAVSGYGVALFDDDEADAAWAAINGGPAIRIDGVGGLDTSILWLTNLDFTAFHRAGLSWNGWVRHSGFLRVKIHQILEEWGLQREDAPTQATYLSGLFSHVMELAAQAGVPAFTGPTLYHDCVPVHPPAEWPKNDAALATRHALQEWTRVAKRVDPAAKLITLHRPRSALATEMLSMQVPVGPWRYIDSRKLPRVRRADWIQGMGVPYFVKIQLHGVEDFGGLLAFGQGARDAENRPLRREWVSAHEFEMLRELAPDLDIDAVWMGTSVVDLQVSEKVSDLLLSPAGHSSWSAGVVAENLWLAATVREQKPPRAADPRISWRAAWLRAVDRIRMFSLAQAMVARGWTVKSYGTGALEMVLPGAGNDVRQMIADAMELGLEPPLSLTKAEPLRGVRWGGSMAAAATAMLRAAGRRDVLLKLDVLPCMDEEAREKLFGDLMGSGAAA